MQFSIRPSGLIAFVQEKEGKPRYPYIIILFPHSRDCTVVLSFTVVGGYRHEGQATNAKPSRMVPKGTAYWNPTVARHGSCILCNIESLRMGHIDGSLFSFLESRRTAFLPHPQNMQAKENGMFDVQSRVITYDEDEQIDGVLLDTLQKQEKKSEPEAKSR